MMNGERDGWMGKAQYAYPSFPVVAGLSAGDKLSASESLKGVFVDPGASPTSPCSWGDDVFD